MIHSEIRGAGQKLKENVEYREDPHGNTSWRAHSTLYLDDFELDFAETFYTGTWFKGFNQKETLSKINTPSIYIKATTQYGEDGVLYAANRDEGAEKVHSLLKGNGMVTIKSGRDRWGQGGEITFCQRFQSTLCAS